MTSPSEGIEAIAEIIPIKFHLQKIAKRSQIRPFKLPTNHILRNLIDDSPPLSTITNPHKIGSLTNHQRILTKGHLIDSYNKSHGIFPSFSPLSIEFSSSHHIIDNFSDHFSFNLVNRKEKRKTIPAPKNLTKWSFESFLCLIQLSWLQMRASRTIVLHLYHTFT